MDFKSQKIAVIGEGVEGVSSAKFLKAKGAKVTILDQKQGKDYLKNLDKYDLIVRSPGVKLEPLKGVPKEKITSQTKLFFDFCPCPIIGVTGTKGKGTTSSLIYEMLKKQGFDAYLGGNIGVPPFEFLDKLNVHSKVVLELSSFQLLDITKSPHIAVLLMVTSEHLDYHNTTENYIDAKRNILKFQTEKDFAVINRDYVASNESDIHTNAKVFYVSTERNGYEGCSIKNNAVFLKQNGKEEKIINASEILLPGKHNLENVCAAIMAATLSGVAKENIVSVLKTFKGLEHRLELVKTVDGVTFYNDSFATGPQPTIAAINSFLEPETVILGGSEKGLDYSELGKIIAGRKNLQNVVLIGAIREKIRKALLSAGFGGKIIDLQTKPMTEIVKIALQITPKGGVVLLSPAAASFDMFANYKERGKSFKEAVLALK